MFTPEFSNPEFGEYILVANHNLESSERVEFSIKYNKSRIEFGKQHLPSNIHNCRLIYDIRGQSISQTSIDMITSALKNYCQIEFKS